MKQDKSGLWIMKPGFAVRMKTVLVWCILLIILGWGCANESDARSRRFNAGRTAAAKNAESPGLRLLTYNVFGERDPSRERLAALFTTIREADADIIALQEAQSWIIQALLEESWTEQYHLPEISWAVGARGCLYFLSRIPIEDSEYSPLPSTLNRGIMTITVKVQGRRVRVGNIHLESMLQAHQMRSRQLDENFAILEKNCDDAVLMGDFNFGENESLENSHIPPEWQDTWDTLHPNRPGYTWNIQKSLFAKQNSFEGEGSRRLDKILVRSDYWRPAASKLVGNEPYVPGSRDRFPSDHFGLVSVLTAASPDSQGDSQEAFSDEGPEKSID